jgi:hypothetical protein
MSSTFDAIKEAIVSLGERNGSSRQAIKKFVLAKKPDLKDHVFNKVGWEDVGWAWHSVL